MARAALEAVLRADWGAASGRRSRPPGDPRRPPAPDLHVLPSGARGKDPRRIDGRSLCGLTTAQVAAVFLVPGPTIGQRLSRARTKIAVARIPFAIPGPEDWPDRLNSVLTVIYLIFTAGYAQGPDSDLCSEAICLALLLHNLAPDQPEVEACLALLLLTQARAAARTGAEGQTLPPSRQDRSLWDAPMIDEGLALLDRAIARQRPGPFQLKPAIAAPHASPDGQDWPQIAALCSRLPAVEPTPVIRLNQAVAVAEAGRPDAALDLLTGLEADLADHQPYHAALAERLARTGQTEAARRAYSRALALTASPADSAILRARLAASLKKGRAFARPSPTGRYEETRASSSSLQTPK